MEIHPITGHFGAEIDHVDLAHPLDPEIVRAIDQAFIDHKVLVFRDQGAVSPPALLALAAHFGAPDVEHHPSHPAVDDIASVKCLTTDGKGYNGTITDSWHCDGSPRTDTMFADMEAAYDNLSPKMKELLDGLVAIHSWGKARPNEAPVEHSVVYIDPRTGRRSIYVNKVYTRAIKGLRQDESDAILNFLFQQTHIPEHQLRASWRPGTIVAWDNQRTQHYIIQDKPYRRIMHWVMVLRPAVMAETAARAA